MNILGVRVDNLDRKEILEKISCFLNENKFHQIATVNPEFILKAQKDEEFKNILNNCDLNVADGIGIKFAFWWLQGWLKFRMAGINLMQEILKIADEKKLKIYLLANNRGLSSWEETALAIQRKYPNLEISGKNIDQLCYSGLDPESTPSNLLDSRFRGNDIEIESDVVFCNFGAPYQEKFLNFIKCGTPPHLCSEYNISDKNSQKNFNLGENSDLQNQRCGGKIKLAVGVGGSFDYLTEKRKRAPKWMQFFGVEWFWRLLIQPKRIGRIWNAVIVFPIKLIFAKNNGQN